MNKLVIGFVFCALFISLYGHSQSAAELIEQKKTERKEYILVYNDSIYKTVEHCYKNGLIGEDSIMTLCKYHKPNNIELAIGLLQLIASKNNPEALCELGIIYVFDYKTSFKEDGLILLQESLNQSYRPAHIYLGLWYFAQKNYELAHFHFEKGDYTTHKGALFSLGYMYENGLGVKTDFQKAFTLYQNSAKLGNVLAQSRVGDIYKKGSYIEKNMERAFYWTYIAADLGHNPSRVILHLPRMKTNNVYNKEESAKLDVYLTLAENLNKQIDFKKQELYTGLSSTLNHEDSMSKERDCFISFYFGSLYYNGDFVEKDYAKAYTYYSDCLKDKSLPNNMLALVCYRIGVMYRYGRGTHQDNHQAEYWTRKAAKLGNLKAYELLEYRTIQ